MASSHHKINCLRNRQKENFVAVILANKKEENLAERIAFSLKDKKN